MLSATLLPGDLSVFADIAPSAVLLYARVTFAREGSRRVVDKGNGLLARQIHVAAFLAERHVRPSFGKAARRVVLIGDHEHVLAVDITEKSVHLHRRHILFEGKRLGVDGRDDLLAVLILKAPLARALELRKDILFRLYAGGVDEFFTRKDLGKIHRIILLAFVVLFVVLLDAFIC